MTGAAKLRRRVAAAVARDRQLGSRRARGGAAISALESHRGKPSLRQHLGMALMHRRQAVPESDPLLSEPDANHASIMRRTLLREIAVLDHLF
jgi:hypothetical protein